MKKRNIAAAILLASMMAVSTCAVSSMTAVAATHTLTINQAANDAATHSYKAYPIFTGTLTIEEGTNKVLSNLVWNDTAVDKDKFVQALYAFDNSAFGALRTGTGGSYTYVTDAAKVAKALNEFSGDTQNLAKVFNTADVLKSAGGVALNKATDGTTGAITYSASGLADGWYVVVDSINTTAKTPDSTGTTNVRSANLLQIVGDTTAGPKYSVPTLTKEIVENSGTTKANQASIGDTVTYKITVPVPDMTGYNKYYYYVEDKLSPGLTFGSISSVVIENGAGTADDKTLTPDDATIKPSEADRYYLKKTESNGTTDTELKIVFEDCLETFKGQTGNIVITYTATLNENAVITDAGNPNRAELVYSNDPNANYSGDTDDKPDEPDSGQPTGETPWDKVKTYTTAVQIKKVDENGKPLSGVKFKLQGTNVKSPVVSSSVTFTQNDATGTYWKLKSGLYTMTAPTDSTKDLYVSNDDSPTTYPKYTRSQTKDTAASVSQNTTDNTLYEITGTVDSTTGVLTFTGLGAGDYKLIEVDHPAGYNTAPDVVFTIGNSPAPDATSAHWTNSNNNFSIEDNMYTITIQNTKGTTLPSTGGIGTTLFYVVGGTLVAGAVVLLITKKRMSINDQK